MGWILHTLPGQHSATNDPELSSIGITGWLLPKLRRPHSSHFQIDYIVFLAPQFSREAGSTTRLKGLNKFSISRHVYLTPATKHDLTESLLINSCPCLANELTICRLNFHPCFPFGEELLPTKTFHSASSIFPVKGQHCWLFTLTTNNFNLCSTCLAQPLNT